MQRMDALSPDKANNVNAISFFTLIALMNIDSVPSVGVSPNRGPVNE